MSERFRPTIEPNQGVSPVVEILPVDQGSQSVIFKKIEEEGITDLGVILEIVGTLSFSSEAAKKQTIKGLRHLHESGALAPECLKIHSDRLKMTALMVNGTPTQ